MFWLPFIAAAAISGGAALIGGLAAKSAAEDQQDRIEAENRRIEEANLAENRRAEGENERIADKNREMAREYAETDFAGRLVNESEAAGFNPLTVLRAGGLSAYVGAYNQASSSSVQAPTATPYYRTGAPQVFIPNAGMALADAFSAVGSVAMGAAQANASHVSSSALLKQQFAGQAALTQARAGVQRGGSAALSGVLGSNTQWEAGDVTVTNPWVTSRVDPGYADAEAMQARYGEPGEWVFGIRNMFQDGLTNLTGRTAEQRQATQNANIGMWGDFLGGLGGLFRRPSTPLVNNYQPGIEGW